MARRALGASSASSRSGPGKIDGGVPVIAHAEPDEVGRPRQVLQPRVGRIPGKPVIRDLGRDRDYSRADREGTPCAISRTFESSLSIGTSRSSVGMTVTRFHGSFCAASLGKTAGPVRPPGIAISDALRASTALSMMNRHRRQRRRQARPGNHSPTIPLRSCESLLNLSRRRLRVSEPSCNRLSAAIERGTEAKPVVSQVAHRIVNRCDPRPAVDGAFADVTARVHPRRRNTVAPLGHWSIVARGNRGRSAPA